MISKILIGFDGTKCAERALEFGLDLAEKYSAEVLIINVLELPTLGTSDDPLATSAGMSGLIKDLRKAHEGILAKGAEKAAQLRPKIKVVTELLEGDPSNQIVLAAKERDYNIIIVGHGGESRMRELFLGGTSERIAHLANCAVLIVK
jgi:nucleotide-binding universal stress UspA family protein